MILVAPRRVAGHGSRLGTFRDFNPENYRTVTVTLSAMTDICTRDTRFSHLQTRLG